MNRECIVIGAGPAGLMAAMKLAEAGVQVMVIEQKINMDKLNRACSMQFIIDDDYEADVMKLEGQKLIFTKCGLEVPYDGKLVPVYNKYYHSPKDHVIRFTRESGKAPLSYKFDKQHFLKSLFDLCAEKGVEFMMGTVVTGGKDLGDEVQVKVVRNKEQSTLTCKKLIIAEGVNAVVSGTFGMNKDRQSAATAYCMKYLMEGITGIENNSWNLYYGECYRSKTACIIGPSLYGDDIFEVTITGSPELMPKKIFHDFTTESPMAPNFRNAKIIKKNGCSVKSFLAMKNPCKGNVMCIGDCAAMVEVETQGGFLCGDRAAKAILAEMKGGNGFEEYTKWWQEAFEFNSDDYMIVSQGYALAFVYTDDELDYLFSLCEGHELHGTYSQYLTPKLIWDCIRLSSAKIKEERPEIYAKMVKMGQAEA
ncbi:MAG: NAD(P)/FAD-dependent oxidoreductase [Stomatobaculum sp.]|nr:NAD(P)/FAD-dependent oxidoreductase [Stomatobaculum sp.]